MSRGCIGVVMATSLGTIRSGVVRHKSLLSPRPRHTKSPHRPLHRARRRPPVLRGTARTSDSARRVSGASDAWPARPRERALGATGVARRIAVGPTDARQPPARWWCRHAGIGSRDSAERICEGRLFGLLGDLQRVHRALPACGWAWPVTGRQPDSQQVAPTS